MIKEINGSRRGILVITPMKIKMNVGRVLAMYICRSPLTPAVTLTPTETTIHSAHPAKNSPPTQSSGRIESAPTTDWPEMVNRPVNFIV